MKIRWVLKVGMVFLVLVLTCSSVNRPLDAC